MVAATGVIAVLLLALGVTMVVQAGRVRRERDRATAEAAKASAINAFLLDALGAADPWQKGSRNVSLLDALRQAQDKAKTSFANQPLVEASVLQTIGTTFSNLAEYPEAEKALKASLDLRVKAAGARSGEAAESLAALSGMYSASRNFDAGEKYAREELEIARGIHGAESVEAATAMYDLGAARIGGGKPKEAKATAEEILTIVRGPRAPERAEAGRPSTSKVETGALLILLQAYLAEENFAKTLALARERLALVKNRVGDRHPEVATALNDVGLGQLYTGDLAGAERTYLESIDLDVALLGENHPEVASTRENLGNVYFLQGQLDKTAKNLEVVLAMRRKALGDDSEPVARTLANIGTVYQRAKNDETAVKNYREAVERLSAKLGPEHPDVGTILAGMGYSLRRLGKYSEAEPAFKRALDIQVKALGEGNAVTQRTIESIVAFYTEWKKPAEAASYTARLTPVEAKAPAAAAK
jgi:eukaryotic-like serine/threonine-protein kinase